MNGLYHITEEEIKRYLKKDRRAKKLVEFLIGNQSCLGYHPSNDKILIYDMDKGHLIFKGYYARTTILPSIEKLCDLELLQANPFVNGSSPFLEGNVIYAFMEEFHLTKSGKDRIFAPNPELRKGLQRLLE